MKAHKPFINKLSSFLFVAACLVSVAPQVVLARGAASDAKPGTERQAARRGEARADRRKPGEAKPNVVFIVADDMGYADVGFAGLRQDIQTPHIDALAKSGVRLTQGYVSAPICSPSRAGFLTGRYQQRFGHERNPQPTDAPNAGLPVEQTTLADVMKRAGYVTGGIGKWHLGQAAHFHPNRRGFDHWFGFLGGGHTYQNWKVDDREYFRPILRNHQPVEVMSYLTTAFSTEAVDFIRRHREQPFFLYLAYNAPHTPLQAPEDHLQQFSQIADPKRRVYAAMLKAIDDGVGEVRRTLRELNLERNTIVIFISDNGGPLPPDGSNNGSVNLPLRAGKSSLYEGGIRVPFVVSWQGTLPENIERHEPVIALDILPTLAAAAKTNLTKKSLIDGVNLLPYLTGTRRSAPHKQLFWRTKDGAVYAVRQGRYKLLRPDRNAAPELYDLERDKEESHNIAAQHQRLVMDLQGAYDAWNKDNIAPVFAPLQSSR